MTDFLFGNIFTSSTLTLEGFLIGIAAALLTGFLQAFAYSIKASYSKSFLVTLTVLPAVVSVVIMLVSGSLGAGVAVAGTFSLIRFRSAPGTAKEIGAIFLAMASGLACGMGYPGFALLFTLIMCLITLILNHSAYGEPKGGSLERNLTVTMPEDLEYADVFSDIFSRYTKKATMTSVKTTNLGSLNKLTWNITLKSTGTEKAMIDEIRTRNGNLEVALTMSALQAPSEL